MKDFSKRGEKIKHAKKSLFFSIFLTAKNIKVLGQRIIKFGFKGVEVFKLKKKIYIHNLYWVLIGPTGPYQYTIFSLINSVR